MRHADAMTGGGSLKCNRSIAQQFNGGIAIEIHAFAPLNYWTTAPLPSHTIDLLPVAFHTISDIFNVTSSFSKGLHAQILHKRPQARAPLRGLSPVFV
jgi:hypothetical protein